MKKLAITLSEEDFCTLEKIRNEEKYPRRKSQQIAWFIKREWERLQEEKREKAAVYATPHYDTRIIPFPARQIGQFPGST